MANKLKFKKEYLYFVLSVGLPILFFWWFLNLNPVEDMVGRWMSFVDPHRREHLHEALSKKTDSTLLNLMHHGDLNTSSVATTELGKRANPELFGGVAKKLKDKNQGVRKLARGLLAALDRARAIPVYLDQLRTLDKNSDEYQQALAILVNLKYQPVYPYLVEYAKREDGWRNGSAYYLQTFGNPESIVILKEQYETAKKKKDTLEMSSIKAAIEHLEGVGAKESGARKAD